MEQQERVENTVIGLQRPFNMPLKSLVGCAVSQRDISKRKEMISIWIISFGCYK